MRKIKTLLKMLYKRHYINDDTIIMALPDNKQFSYYEHCGGIRKPLKEFNDYLDMPCVGFSFGIHDKTEKKWVAHSGDITDDYEVKPSLDLLKYWANYKADGFIRSKHYDVGDVILYKGQLYKCVRQYVYGKNFNPQDWITLNPKEISLIVYFIYLDDKYVNSYIYKKNYFPLYAYQNIKTHGNSILSNDNYSNIAKYSDNKNVDRILSDILGYEVSSRKLDPENEKSSYIIEKVHTSNS